MRFYHVAPLHVHSPVLAYASRLSLAYGALVRIEVKHKIYDGLVLEEVSEPAFACKEIIQICGFFGNLQQHVARFIAYYYRSNIQDAYKSFYAFCPMGHFSLAPYAPLQTLRLRHIASMPLLRPLTLEEKQRITSNLPTLSTKQTAAYKFLASKQKGLLFGDTGSGKTEIYFHHIARALQQDKSVLFLMPEIALTPQTLARLQKIFGECVALWHSKVSAKSKKQILHDLHTQKLKIIAGARSALFLPLAHLGLIIVDEEHDDAYKSMSNPRYNARDLALFLGQRARIKVILGSATPSLTSYNLACLQGYMFRLKGGFYEAKKQFVLESSIASITPALSTHIEQALQQHKQVIVFVPTRANFKTLRCLDCGYGFVCPFCSVTMSVHFARNALCCHYCHYQQLLPSVCVECDSSNLSSKRVGTAQVSAELKELFPYARIGVFDRDHITTQKKLTALLSDFRAGKLDILVGTQMLSKGHDYHNVALVCVMGIDYVLQGGDFRSLERGVATLHQIAGRTGRKESGIVLIQSLQSVWLEQFLEDYEVFLRWELSHRSKVYPPATRLAMIHIDNRKQELAHARMLAILQHLQRTASRVTILGYGANAIERIADRWRFHILLYAKRHSEILRALEDLGALDVDMDCIDTL